MPKRFPVLMLRFGISAGLAGNAIGIIAYIHSPLIGPSDHTALAITMGLFILVQASLSAAYCNSRVSNLFLMTVSALWSVPGFLLFKPFAFFVLMIPVFHLMAFVIARAFPVDEIRAEPEAEPSEPPEPAKSSQPDDLYPGGRRPDWTRDR